MSRSYMHFPGSSVDFKIYFSVHSYTFWNFKKAITPKISEIDMRVKLVKFFIFWMGNIFVWSLTSSLSRNGIWSKEEFWLAERWSHDKFGDFVGHSKSTIKCELWCCSLCRRNVNNKNVNYNISLSPSCSLSLTLSLFLFLSLSLKMNGNKPMFQQKLHKIINISVDS